MRAGSYTRYSSWTLLRPAGLACGALKQALGWFLKAENTVPTLLQEVSDCRYITGKVSLREYQDKELAKNTH